MPVSPPALPVRLLGAMALLPVLPALGADPDGGAWPADRPAGEARAVADEPRPATDEPRPATDEPRRAGDQPATADPRTAADERPVRTIPRLTLPDLPEEPADPTAPDHPPAFLFEIEDASLLESRRQTTPADPEPLAEDRIRALLERLLPAPAPPDELSARPGAPLASPALAARPPPADPAPLQVLAAFPSGEADLAPDVTVAFSHPMVPLGMEGAPAAGPVPARLHPEPPGTWRWLDVRTLRFEPDEGRLPAATAYELEVPAGTEAAGGGSLAEAFHATFSTAGPRAVGGTLSEPELTDLQPVVLLVFDQDVDPQDVLTAASLHAFDRPHPLRLADETELETEDPRLLLAAREAGPGRWVALSPERPLPEGAHVVLTLDASLPSAEGPLPAGRAQELRFRVRPRFSYFGSPCGDAADPCRPAVWRGWFSTPLDPDLDYLDLVQVEPAVENLQAIPRLPIGYGLTLLGDFRPHTSYRITLEPGIRDTFGQELGRRVEVQAHFGPPTPRLRIPGAPFLTLDPEEPPILELHVRGLPSVEVEVHRVEPEDWADFADPDWPGLRAIRDAPLPGEPVFAATLPTEDGGDGFSFLPVDLTPALGHGRGHAAVIARDPDDPRREVRAWVQVTTLGLGAIWNAEEVAVWTASLVDGSALPETDLRLHPSGRTLQTGTDGTATFALSPDAPDSLLIASRGDETALITPRLAHSLRQAWEAEPSAPHPIWFSITDRGLYQPGESLRGHGWIRELEGGSRRDLARPIRTGKVAWRLIGPRRDLLSEGTVPVRPSGAFHIEAELPPSVRSGRHRLELQALAEGEPVEGWMSHHDFSVESFRRPEYEVRLETDPGPRVAGEPVEVRVEARYFDGPGLPDAPVTWHVRATPGGWVPPGWHLERDWSFGRFGVPFADRQPGPRVEVHRGATNREGAHAVRVTPEPPTFGGVATLSLTAEVQDLDRRAGARTTSVPILSGALLPAIRLRDAWIPQGRATRVDAVAVDVEGRVRSGARLRVSAQRMAWDRSEGFRVMAPAGSERPLACEEGFEEDMPGGAGSVLRCPFQPDSAAPYRIAVEVTDDEGRTSRSERVLFAVGARPGGSHGSWWGAVPRLELTPQRTDHAPGDTARVLVTAPFDEGVGVLVVFRHGMREVRRLELDGGSARVEIPLHPEDAGGLLVMAQAAPARGGRGVVQAMANVDVSAESRRLEVSVAAREERSGPGEEVDVQVEVRDPEGRPVPDAEVTLWAVDEAILGLARYRLPDVLQAVHRGRGDVPGTAYLTHSNVRWAPRPLGPGILSAEVLDAATGNPATGLEVRLLLGDEAPPERPPPGEDAPGPEIRTRLVPGDLHLPDVPAGHHLLRIYREGAPIFERAVVVPDEGLHLGVVLVTYEPDPAVALREAAVARTGFAARDWPPAAEIPAPPRSDFADTEMPAGYAPPTGVDAGEISLREDFRPLAAFEPAVALDGEGRAQVRIRLPHTVTRYRIFAVASEGDARFGSGEGGVIAARDLVVRASPPARLREGDAPELTVTVQNGAAEALAVEVAARARGLELDGARGFRVTVPAGDRREVRFPARAGAVGTARVEVVAAAGAADAEEGGAGGEAGPADGVAVTIPVEALAAPRTVALQAEVPQGESLRLPVEVPPGAVPGQGELTVTLSPTLLAPMADVLRRLWTSPAPWPEPTVSRVLASVAMDPLLRSLPPDGLPDREELRARTAADVERLARWLEPWLRAQREIGAEGFDLGFSSWFSVLYGIHALIAAAEADYAVPAWMLSSATHALSRFVERDREGGQSGQGERPVPVRRITAAAYVLDLLSRLNPVVAAEHAGPWLADLEPEDLPVEALAWFLRATAGEPALGSEHRELLRALENRAVTTAGSATFRRGQPGVSEAEDLEIRRLVLASDRRSDAVALEALNHADPDHPLIPALVRGLVGHRDGSAPGRTHENGWVLLALGAFAEAGAAAVEDEDGEGPRDRSPLVARVALGEAPLAEVTFDGAASPEATHVAPLPRPGSRDDLVVEREGDGALYVRAAARFSTPAKDLAPVAAGFLVSRRYEAVDDPDDVVRASDGTWQVRAGARVRVRVTFTALSRRYQVQLHDPLPGGFEMLNPGLAGTGFAHDPGPGARIEPHRGAPPSANLGLGPGLDWEAVFLAWRLRYGPWATHEERRADGMWAYAPILPAGAYETTYLVRAIGPGTYTVPPAAVEESEYPETFGRGVVDRVGVADAEARPPW